MTSHLSSIFRPLTAAGLWAVAACVAVFASPARGAEITPFDTFNQSPLVQIYGLPAPGRATVLPPGRSRAGLSLDLASNFAHDSNAREAILLDGETTRGTFSYRRGIAKGFEAGLELPVVSQNGGFLDGFIEGWHRFFALPNGGRPDAPRNRLLYVYVKDGTERFRYTRSEVGIGDLRLTGGGELYRGERSAIALRAALKLPTGESASLLGSGSTDFALWGTGQRDFSTWGHSAVFASLGGLVKSPSDVLPGQQRYLVGFGSVGAGWSPVQAVAFKLQLSSHTPFYRQSDLPELNRISTLLLIGGTVAVSPHTALDIGVSEDVAVNGSPDVDFHLSLKTDF